MLAYKSLLKIHINPQKLIYILITSRNGDSKIMPVINLTSRPLTDL